MQVKEPQTEFIRDYQALIKENKELKKEKNKLEIRIELLEKALLFLADQVDECFTEQGLRSNVKYHVEQILQK